MRALHELHRSSPLRVEVARRPLRVAAREHLRGFDLFVEPRKQWPSGMAARRMPKGRIAEEERPETGRALSVMGDGGWGRLVASGRGEDERFARRPGDRVRRADRASAGDPSPRPRG